MIAQIVDRSARPRQAALRRAGGRESSSDSNAVNEDARMISRCRRSGDRVETQRKLAQMSATQVLLQSNTENTAVQHDLTEAQEEPQQSSRRARTAARCRDNESYSLELLTSY